MYSFSLKIDDSKHSLNAENGISIEIISDLLRDLYSAIDFNENSKCTLSNIRGNCYAMDFSTESINQLERFKIVHRNIQDVPIKDLEYEQKKYARTLKKIIDNKFYINAYDENGEKIATINEIVNEKEIKYYYSQKTIYGYLSELGAKSIDSDSKHIIIDGFPYRIYITKDLDLQLKSYYGTEKLAVKIRVQRAFQKGNIIRSEMISFKEVGKLSFSENLAKEGFIPLNILNNTSTIEGIIDAIYGNK
jgi:adenylate kinase family enzyme